MANNTETFIVNLVSNASMSTFPDNTLADFSTLLPNSLNLSGSWEVAIVEISWPDSIQNVTEGRFSYQVAKSPSIAKVIPVRPQSGMVSMINPLEHFNQRKKATSSFQPEQFVSIPKGCYPSVDSILQVIYTNMSEIAGWDTDKTKFKWKISPTTQLLQTTFEKDSADETQLRLRASSKDLQNILGLEHVIDCCETEIPESENAESHLVSKKLKRDTIQNYQKEGMFPVDLRAGCHTMFVYCDLVQNEILGDSQTALLRAIPLYSNKNHESFTKLQWRRVIKSTIHSITISLRSETGALIPFLSRGRTNMTLQFRRVG